MKNNTRQKLPAPGIFGSCPNCVCVLCCVVCVCFSQPLKEMGTERTAFFFNLTWFTVVACTLQACASEFKCARTGRGAHGCVCVCVWVTDSSDLFNMPVKPELLSLCRHACVNSSTPT